MSGSRNHLDAYRRWGYLQASLDALGRLAPVVHPELREATGREPGARWYCGMLAAEFMHLADPGRVRWIQERFETDPPATDGARILDRLLRAELFESALQKRYVATRRFSIEGCIALLPLLAAAIEKGAEAGVERVVLASSHRGRLNLIANILGRDPAEIFAQFEDADPRSVLGGGDVKYHLGATGVFRTSSGSGVRVSLVSNPSHLESVDPVAMGRTRALQDRRGRNGRREVLPVTLHGDAAFAGQGIAAETLNMADLPGYSVGGTVHVVVNNLIGFTTTPESLHSSRFATAVARRGEIPILHVNGEDPDAAVRAAVLAAEYRAAWAGDIVIDLIGYRRHGHSEVDDPALTQPLLYDRIRALRPLSESYAERRGISRETLEKWSAEISREFAEALERGRGIKTRPILYTLPEYWSGYRGGPASPADELDTGVESSMLRRLGHELVTVPKGFAVHPKVAKGLQRRRIMVDGAEPVDWATAEALAFASLIREGVRVRLAGQDARRGTFNQRHAAIYDTSSGAEHVPLAHVEGAAFEAVDSPLSEAAPLGFEFGYSRDAPDALVLWEAQFGDFANGAQTLIDQFVASAEDKWGLLSGVVLLLPHGFEGQGPEHSSARIERFLQLAAEDNLQVCQPSTAAQFFHLLRRQALRKWRKPLVVFTPKSALRLPAAASPWPDFTGGRFRPVLREEIHGPVERIVLCSGKIAHELRAERRARGLRGPLVATIEQLYPFPELEVSGLLETHPEAREIVWVQEEPGNMGALPFLRTRLERLAGGRRLRRVHRSESASPATGSKRAHDLEQAALLALAFLEGEEDRGRRESREGREDREGGGDRAGRDGREN